MAQQRALVFITLILISALTRVGSASARVHKKPGGTVAEQKTSPKTLTAQQIFAKWKSRVCTVETDKGTGTGFRGCGGLVTCYHVVEGAATVSAHFPDTFFPKGLALSAKPNVLRASKARDIVVLGPIGVPGGLSDVDRLATDWDVRYLISLLRTSNPGKDLSDIRSGLGLALDETGWTAAKVAVGDPIYVIGSPEGLEQTLTQGIVSSKRAIGGATYLQITAPVSHGSSGSPVLDNKGNVVGVIVGQLPGAQQLNFAVTIDEVKKLDDGVPLDMIRF